MKTFSSFASRVVGGAIILLVSGVLASEQLIQLERGGILMPLPAPADEPYLFWERFTAAFQWRLDDVYADRFHPLSTLSWRLRAGEGGELFRDNADSAARNLFAKSALYGVREATANLPLFTWLEYRQEFLAELIRNSLGNVDEEAVSPGSVTYRAAEQFWWDRLSQPGAFRYGVRPFRADPYAFLSLALREGDTLLFMAHLRYHYHLLAEHGFELALAVPLAYGLTVNLGTSYYFERDNPESLGVKIFKTIGQSGILHLGLKVQDRPVFIAGLDLSW